MWICLCMIFFLRQNKFILVHYNKYWLYAESKMFAYVVLYRALGCFVKYFCVKLSNKFKCFIQCDYRVNGRLSPDVKISYSLMTSIYETGFHTKFIVQIWIMYLNGTWVYKHGIIIGITIDVKWDDSFIWLCIWLWIHGEMSEYDMSVSIFATTNKSYFSIDKHLFNGFHIHFWNISVYVKQIAIPSTWKGFMIVH